MRKSRLVIALCMGVAWSMVGASGQTLATPQAERLTILWPASARLLAGQPSKAAHASRGEGPIRPGGVAECGDSRRTGRGLTWTADVVQTGEYDVYLEFQIAASGSKHAANPGPLRFRLEADGAVLQA